MFNTKISLYALMILLSLISNVVVVMHISRQYHFTKYEIIGALIYENICIIVGAKVLTYLQEYKTLGTFNFLDLGFTSYGAVIGAIIGLTIFSLQFRKSPLEMLFTFTPSIPLMYAIGKLGCFLVGCCHGIEYSGWGSITYQYSQVALNNVHYFPIQLVESIVFTIIFIYIIIYVIKKKFNLKVLGISMILCGISKFALDYLRISHVEVVISLNQIISVFFIMTGVILYLISKKIIREENNYVLSRRI